MSPSLEKHTRVSIFSSVNYGAIFFGKKQVPLASQEDLIYTPSVLGASFRRLSPKSNWRFHFQADRLDHDSLRRRISKSSERSGVSGLIRRKKSHTDKRYLYMRKKKQARD